MNLPAYGTEIEGGFFAGVVQIDGQQYGVVVAPKTEGEMRGTWGERGKDIDAKHLADGAANTKAMAEAGSEIGKWAQGLDINGHQDWYIPARDELELIYRNLKPTEQENYCSFRDGENPSSVPMGHFYTDESPAQTPVEAFQDEGSEAMEEAWYWSSTQCSAYNAFFQNFTVGNQGYFIKGYDNRVRAVRRFIIN